MSIGGTMVAAILIVAGFIGAAHFATKKAIMCNPRDLSKELSRDDVLAKCGNPRRINYNGTREQWVYPNGFPDISATYLYIEKDKFDDAQWTE
jgi:hypothetical protein